MKLITAIFTIVAMSFTSQAADPETKPVAGPSTKLPSTELTTGRTGKHLFILSGQSNMARLKSRRRFTPHVEKAFGKDSVIVVEDAHSGAPIRAWYNVSEPAGGSKPESPEKGRFYYPLTEKVIAAIKDQKVATVTFIWMQGESDAAGKGKVADYEANLKGLIAAIKKDLEIEAMNIVIGRLSDHGLTGGKHQLRAWTKMREIQMTFADETPNCEWIDTDDLNNKDMNSKHVGGYLHYTGAGYDVLGQRFAEKAIEIINKK